MSDFLLISQHSLPEAQRLASGANLLVYGVQR